MTPDRAPMIGDTTSSCQIFARSGKLRDSPMTMRATAKMSERPITAGAPLKSRGRSCAREPSKASAIPRTSWTCGTTSDRTTARNSSSLVAK
jgi:hypothetical protein